MGRPKLLMSLGQRPILLRTVDNYLNSKVDEVIVVLGHKADEMKRLISDRPVKIAVNPDYEEGMSTSIVAGLGLIHAKSQAVMLALADQPFIDPPAIDCLVAALSHHKKGIIVPVQEGKRGHPVIFRIKYRPELLELKGDVGGREIVARHPDDVLEVAVNCPGINVDIDTLTNYHFWERKN